MGLYSSAAQNQSAVASGIRLRTTGLFSRAVHHESAMASGIRLRTTGLFSPAVHHESAVASGIRLRTMGLFLSTMLLKAAGAPRDGLEQGDSSLPRVEQKAVRTSSVKVVHVSCINEKVMIPVKES